MAVKHMQVVMLHVPIDTYADKLTQGSRWLATATATGILRMHWRQMLL